MAIVFLVLALCLLVPNSSCHDLLITKRKINELKETVEWNVVDYEESPFRGWTVAEASRFLLSPSLLYEISSLSSYKSSLRPPGAVSWMNTTCVHPARNQGKCSSCWAFAVAGMVSDRCCLKGTDYGWLSSQELISCDKQTYGCSGGWALYATEYVSKNHGLVPEDCFPYAASTPPCPYKCKDGKDWTTSHKCSCRNPQKCVGVDAVKNCIAKGPMVLTMEVCESLFYYVAGIYKCDCKSNILGLQSITAIGYSEEPECHIMARNSWGNEWGTEGFFNVSCTTCGIEDKYQYGNVMCEIS